MAENTINLTQEQLVAIVEQSVKHALTEVTSHEEVTTKASSKALDAFKDVAKDHASESLFELYKEALVGRARECIMFLMGSLLNFIFHNIILVLVFVAVAAIVAIASIIFDRKRKQHKTDETSAEKTAEVKTDTAEKTEEK